MKIDLRSLTRALFLIQERKPAPRKRKDNGGAAQAGGITGGVPANPQRSDAVADHSARSETAGAYQPAAPANPADFDLGEFDRSK